MARRVSAALTCAALVLFALIAHARAASVEEIERAQWSAEVSNALDSVIYEMPTECISNFCSTEMATVSFRIMPDGMVSDVVISKSSGDEIVDRHAIEFVKKLSPLPASPSYTDLTPLSYTFRYGFANPQWRTADDAGAPSDGDLDNRRSYDQPARQPLPPSDSQNRQKIYVQQSECQYLRNIVRHCQK